MISLRGDLSLTFVSSFSKQGSAFVICRLITYRLLYDSWMEVLCLTNASEDAQREMLSEKCPMVTRLTNVNEKCSARNAPWSRGWQNVMPSEECLTCWQMSMRNVVPYPYSVLATQEKASTENKLTHGFWPSDHSYSRPAVYTCLPGVGFQKLDIRKCIQNIRGNRDVALWIPQSFLQERIMSLDGIGEASTIQKSFLACVH